MLCTVYACILFIGAIIDIHVCVIYREQTVGWIQIPGPHKHTDTSGGFHCSLQLLLLFNECRTGRHKLVGSTTAFVAHSYYS